MLYGPRAARVKGGEAGERSERTLDSGEHGAIIGPAEEAPLLPDSAGYAARVCAGKSVGWIGSSSAPPVVSWTPVIPVEMVLFLVGGDSDGHAARVQRGVPRDARPQTGARPPRP